MMTVDDDDGDGMREKMDKSWFMVKDRTFRAKQLDLGRKYT